MAVRRIHLFNSPVLSLPSREIDHPNGVCRIVKKRR